MWPCWWLLSQGIPDHGDLSFRGGIPSPLVSRCNLLQGRQTGKSNDEVVQDPAAFGMGHSQIGGLLGLQPALERSSYVGWHLCWFCDSSLSELGQLHTQYKHLYPTLCCDANAPILGYIILRLKETCSGGSKSAERFRVE